MNFDSKLVIIATNISPTYMAESMGIDNKDAMLRRFQDSCGSCYVVKASRGHGSFGDGWGDDNHRRA